MSLKQNATPQMQIMTWDLLIKYGHCEFYATMIYLQKRWIIFVAIDAYAWFQDKPLFVLKKKKRNQGCEVISLTTKNVKIVT